MDGRTARAHLGVAEHATDAELARAYRRQARLAHPDAGGDAHQFVTLTSAFRAARTAPGFAPPPPPAAPSVLAARHGFCAYDSPPRQPAPPRFDTILAHALDRELAR